MRTRRTRDEQRERGTKATKRPWNDHRVLANVPTKRNDTKRNETKRFTRVEKPDAALLPLCASVYACVSQGTRLQQGHRTTRLPDTISAIRGRTVVRPRSPAPLHRPTTGRGKPGRTAGREKRRSDETARQRGRRTGARRHSIQDGRK
ncbi:hypothetical protein QLX08_010759 [Tetragonisca angustula]|uniref:Uncharacterized protein n=1 Tax=Tetragonisca angustula TaxID=166442 RepID=A0AAW0ZAN0_9HYME